jgi:hypothetical protein
VGVHSVRLNRVSASNDLKTLRNPKVAIGNRIAGCMSRPLPGQWVAWQDGDIAHLERRSPRPGMTPRADVSRLSDPRRWQSDAEHAALNQHVPLRNRRLSQCRGEVFILALLTFECADPRSSTPSRASALRAAPAAPLDWACGPWTDGRNEHGPQVEARGTHTGHTDARRDGKRTVAKVQRGKSRRTFLRTVAPQQRPTSSANIRSGADPSQ